MTPDESTTTDARPVVGEAATAYYMPDSNATAASIFVPAGKALIGTVSGLGNSKATLTWAGAASLSAAAATVAVAALF